ncbi:Rieske 2Fe-2S domain-containing protein [Nonomuraea sp. NPDC005650]|uniref:Rieske (2Fe-2S) protein n=1 Tax=Nonomuraea sp. NPDC005650 TaxID=3157045 RepID=UPI0033BF3CF8
MALETPGKGVVVAPLSAFPSGSRRIVKVASREIGVFRVGDSFYAVRNRCPHQGAQLCLGHLRQKTVSDAPGVVGVDDGPPLIVCPWHGWQWDAATGQAYAPGDPKVRSYGVSVEAGADLVGDQLVAETYKVSVEDDYVVLYA